MKISYSLSRWMSLLAFVLCGFEANAETATLWISGVSEGGGWYDVNKANPKAEDGDNNLCYAAAASNLIAWWQCRYRIEETIPNTAESIWNAYKEASKEDVGGDVGAAVQWWLSGVDSPVRKDDESRSVYSYSADNKSLLNQFDGYYYDQCNLSNYNEVRYIDSNGNQQYDKDVDPLRSYPVALGDFIYTLNESTGVTDGVRNLPGSSDVLTLIENGYGVALSITDEGVGENKLAHAITLWGVDYDVESKAITALYLTDSDDEQYDKNTDGLFRVESTISDDGRIIFSDYWGDRVGDIYVSGLYGINPAVSDSWGLLMVPEPATATLGLLALTGLAVRRRRR